MDTPLLSIITINYNNAQGLAKTINSVISQPINDYSQIEYIIVDGASTDESISIIKNAELKKGNLNFIWNSEPDSGIYNAMNKGIKKSNGKYIHMLNSGDYLEPNVLEVIIEKLHHNPDLLLCGINLIEPVGIVKTEVRHPCNLNYGSMSHQGMIYLKAFHEKLGFYDEKYKFASDYDFSLKAFYNKQLYLEVIYNPCVNFECGGVGVSNKSMEELQNIKIKAGLIKPPTKNYLKRIIKFFVPYGLILLYQKIK